MRTFTFCLLLLLSLFSSLIYAQWEFWGTTASGGKDNIGVIFKTDSNVENYEVIHHFKKDNIGAYPYGSLLEYNGLLYGMTKYGGEKQYGDIFIFDPESNEIKTIFSFDQFISGSYPEGELIEYNGLLYGFCRMGGTSGRGTLFSIDPESYELHVLQNFNDEIGAHPKGHLTVFNHKLYGLAPKGGESQRGVLFEFDLETRVYEVKVYFNQEIGSNPDGSLLLYENKLYGFCPNGGEFAVWPFSPQGVLFEFDPVEDIYTKRVDFNGAEKGDTPLGYLIEKEGILWGTTIYGGTNDDGVLFAFDPNTGEFEKKFEFNKPETGRFPYSKLILHQSHLFGICASGRMNFDDLLYSFNTETAEFKIEKEFNEIEGVDIFGSPYILDAKLYGMCSRGGLEDYGTLYSYDFQLGTFNKLIDFSSASMGSSPAGGFVENEGKIYGSTRKGGKYGFGILYKIDLSGKFTKLLDFDSLTTGGRPIGTLFRYEDKFYGYCSMGGSHEVGVLFTLDVSNEQYEVIHHFRKQEDGAFPWGTMILFNNKLYGVCRNGGVKNAGTIWSYELNAKEFKKEADFDYDDEGFHPQEKMLIYKDQFYGTTGGDIELNYGTIFRFDPGNGNLKRLYNWENPWGSLGSHPSSPLVISNDKFYGLTWDGGVHYDGVLYEFNRQNNKYKKKLDLEYETQGSGCKFFTLEINGMYYGICSNGGKNYDGTIFTYEPSTNDFTVLYDFIDTTGSNPFRVELFQHFLSLDAEILSFTLPEQSGPAIIDPAKKEVHISVSRDSDLSSLLPEIIISPGASIEPSQGSIVDLSEPFVYTLTAENPSVITEWTVFAQRELSQETDIIAFSLAEETGPAIIDAIAHYVSSDVQYGTDLTALSPVITISEGASIIPESGSIQNFSAPLFYTITAENGINTQVWEINVQAAPNNETQILSFELAQQVSPAHIDQILAEINLTVELGTDLSNLSPEISVSDGASINPASGTIQDFTQTVLYTVTAEDGINSQVWTVKVVLEPNNETQILEFEIPEQIFPTIIHHELSEIDVEVGPETDVSALTPTITISEGATINPESGSTQNFTNPVLYSVVAENELDQQNWLVSVSIVSNIEMGTEKRLKIYPNPLNELLYIDSDYPIKKIRIYSYDGELIKEKEINFDNQVYLGFLPSGFYILRFQIEGETISHKLIIQ